MLIVLAFSAIAAAAPAPALCVAPPPSSVAGDSTDLVAIWRDGVSFADFVGAMKDRKADWKQRSEWAVITDDMRARVRGITGNFRVLAVTAEQCGDSMNTLPYFAALLDGAANIEMRLVVYTRAKSVMEAHRTPDGRAATPTIVILDANDRLVGCYIERPAALLAWTKTPKDSLPAGQRYNGRSGWYEANRGQASIGELLALLERAAKGEGACP